MLWAVNSIHISLMKNVIIQRRQYFENIFTMSCAAVNFVKNLEISFNSNKFLIYYLDFIVYFLYYLR